MKTIGLLGGMSWESTLVYYRAINQEVKRRLGGLHSARILINSLDFAGIEILQRKGDWQSAGVQLAEAAQALQRAGADFILIGTNTMHRVADEVEGALRVPLLHIADATAEELNRRGISKVGLLGTAFTMEQAFYRDRLARRQIEVIIPPQAQRQEVHRVIYEELCQGQCLEASRQRYLEIIDALHRAGAEGVILGCTEIGLLVNQDDTSMPLFDTCAIHACKAVDWALS